MRTSWSERFQRVPAGQGNEVCMQDGARLRRGAPCVLPLWLRAAWWTLSTKAGGRKVRPYACGIHFAVFENALEALAPRWLPRGKPDADTMVLGIEGHL